VKILVSALEHSANIHLTSVMKYMPNNTELIGIFDKKLGQPIVDLQSSAVMGYVDALKKLGYYLRLLSQMAKMAKDVDKVLLIDASGFNMPLAKRIKKLYPDKEIIYYILPEAWAWKANRIPKLEQRVDRLASILPFESSYYSSLANIEYVGHPLLDQIHELKSSVNKDIQDIAFMAGSRKSIILKLMPIFREVHDRLKLNSTIIIPTHFSKDEINELYGDLAGFKISHDAHATLLKSDFAFICKGTATLEASLIGVPFVLMYMFSTLDYLIYDKILSVEHLGLGNILLKHHRGKELHPELLQDDVTADKLIAEMRNMDREKFFYDSRDIKEYLSCGSAQKVANIILSEKK